MFNGVKAMLEREQQEAEMLALEADRIRRDAELQRVRLEEEVFCCCCL
jgi:hypothetical protein